MSEQDRTWCSEHTSHRMPLSTRDRAWCFECREWCNVGHGGACAGCLRWQAHLQADELRVLRQEPEMLAAAEVDDAPEAWYEVWVTVETMYKSGDVDTVTGDDGSDNLATALASASQQALERVLKRA